jgi:outer membrane protein
VKISSITFVAIASLTASQFTTAFAQGDMIPRVGLTTVAPNESSSNILAGGADLGFGLNVNNHTQPGLKLGYFITDNWSIEVLAATLFKHDVNVNANPIGLEKLAEVTHLPPTVTANYYFADRAAEFQPYAGVGLNYTPFFDEEFTSANVALGFNELELDASFDISAQVGFDYMINKKWFVNASARYIDISTNATSTLDNTDLGFNNAPGEVTVDIDPWVYTVSLGYKF